MGFVGGLFFVIACVVVCALLFWVAHLLLRILFVLVVTAIIVSALYSYSLLPAPLEEAVSNFLSSEPVTSVIEAAKSWHSEQKPPEQSSGVKD